MGLSAGKAFMLSLHCLAFQLSSACAVREMPLASIVVACAEFCLQAADDFVVLLLFHANPCTGHPLASPEAQLNCCITHQSLHEPLLLAA